MLGNVSSAALFGGISFFSYDDGSSIVDGHAGGEHIAFFEGVLELVHTDASFIHDIFSGTAREQATELVVECD